MKKLNHYLMLVAAIAVMMLASCSKAPESVKLLPEDTAIIVRLDVKKMIDKSNAADNKELKEKLGGMLKGESMGADLRQQLEKILDDPAKAGIDLREPLYVSFGMDRHNVAYEKSTLVGTILDSGDFETLLAAVGKEDGKAVQEKNGVKYIEDDGIVIAFNDESFTIAPIGQGVTLDDVLARFGDKANNALADNENFAKMQEQGGIVQVLMTGDAFVALYDDQVKKMLPEGADPKDMSMLMDLDTSKGKATLKGTVLTKSEAWKKYMEQGDDLMDDIDGDAVKYVSKEGFALFANIDGAKLYEVISKSEALGKQMDGETSAQAKRILESIDGDIAIGVGNMGGNQMMPAVTAYIKTKNQMLVDEAKKNGLDRMGDLSIGYDKGFTYVLMGEQKTAFAEPATPIASSDIKGKHFYAYMDFQAIADVAGMFAGRSAQREVESVSDLLKTLEIGYEGDGKGSAVLTMKDESKDPLALLIDMMLAEMK